MATPAVMDVRGVRRRGQAYVALSALAWSTAGLLQRELPVDTATQVAGRAFFGALALGALVAFTSRGGLLRSFTEIGLPGLAVAASTAVASATFIVALNHASVASVLFLQALAPLAAALIGRVILHEPVSRLTFAAMAVALLGVGVMVGGPGGAHGLGLALSAVMTVMFALSVVLTRRQRATSMTPAVCLSQVLVLIAFAPFAHPGVVDGRDLALLITLGVGQMGLGLAFLTLGTRLLPAAEVALIILLEIVLGPLWVWLALSERPANATLLGGAIVIAAVALQASGTNARSAGRRR